MGRSGDRHVRARIRSIARTYADLLAAGSGSDRLSSAIEPLIEAWDVADLPVSGQELLHILDQAQAELGRANVLPRMVNERGAHSFPVGEGRCAHSPSITLSPRSLHACWIDSSSRGHAPDTLVYAHRSLHRGGWSEPRQVGPSGAYFRPSIAGRGDDTSVLLYTDLGSDQPTVCAREVAGDPPIELISSAFNQEAIVDATGDIHLVAQVRGARTWQVGYVKYSDGRTTFPELVSDSTSGAHAWDPTLAVSSRGVLWVVWSAWRAGQYVLEARARRPAGWSEPIEIREPDGCHAMHPHLSAGIDGSVWLAYDVVTVPGIGSSGHTVLVGPTPSKSKRAGRVSTPASARTRVGVAVLSEGRRSAELRRPRQPDIARPGSLGYPRIAVSGSGRVWLAYRSLRRLPLRQFYSEVEATCLSSDWTSPVALRRSDGGSAEASVAAGGSDVAYVSWQSDNRRSRAVRMKPALLGGVDAGLIRRHLGDAVWDAPSLAGVVRVSAVSPEDKTQPRPPETESIVLSPARRRARAVGDERRMTLRDGEKTYTLLWGDLHRHSNVSRCESGLEIDLADQFRIVMDSFSMDFWAMTDHAEHTSDFNWRYLRQLVKLYELPEVHLPMLGFEWSSTEFGHLNVIYPGTDGPIFSATDHASDSPAKLFRCLGNWKALAIPHHPASFLYPTDWTTLNSDRVRVAEIFQAATGSYESTWCHRQALESTAEGSTIQSALASGARVGLIASTDHLYGAAYAGVFALNRSRQAIFDALYERRCFGATRRGIVPALNVGSTVMGGVVSPGMQSVEFGGQGISDLASVQLVRNGAVVSQVAPAFPSPEPPRGAYQIDIRLWSGNDGERNLAGSLTVRGGRIRHGIRHARFVTGRSRTTVDWDVQFPQRYGLFVNPSCAATFGVTAIAETEDCYVLLNAGGERFNLAIAEIGAEPLTLPVGRGAEVGIRLGLGSLDSLGVDRASSREQLLLEAGDYLYVRVVQSDGEAAWSSPIWVR